LEEGRFVPSFLIESICPNHGMERYRIKIIKKYNIDSEKIALQFRTRPRYEVRSVVIGRNVGYEKARDYLMQHLGELAIANGFLSIRLQK
jgi:hypothetical protein